MDMYDLKQHCRMMNCDCFLHVDPCDWKIDKINEVFEKLSTFHYGFTRFDYI